MEAINALFTNLLTIIMGVAVAAAACFLAWGAVVYMTAGGSPHQMERGKAAMMNALIGLAVVLLARPIVGMIQTALGTTS
jgi:hypothetical protein